MQIIGYVLAWQHQRFEICICVIIAATAVVFLFFGPGWPMCNRKELDWLDPDSVELTKIGEKKNE